MFESFSFAAASRHPSSPDPDDYEYPDLAVSPTSSPMSEQSFPDPAMSVAELSRRFGAQNITSDLCQSPASPFELPAPWTEHDDDWPSTSASSPSSSYFPDDALPDPAATRARRQAHTALQCDAAHMRDISSLVKKMIESGDQCKLASRSDSVVSSDCCGDDADDETYDLPRSASSPAISQSLRYRRSGEVLSTAAVSKNIRFRRRHPRKVAAHR